MNRPTDTVDEKTEIDNALPDKGGDPLDRQTPGHDAGERSTDDAKTAKAKDDDLVAEQDPLVRARKGAYDDKTPKPVAKPAAEKQETAAEEEPEETAEVEEPAKDGETPADDGEPAKEEVTEAKPKAAAKKANPDDDKLLDADLPPEDWQKLTHKGKSLFLGVRKLAKAAKAEVTEARKEADKHRGDYEAVDGFVKGHGLAGEEFRNGVITLGMAKRGDARVIPALENTLAELRRANGIAEKSAEPAKPAAPIIDADEFEKEIAAAEASFDFEKLKGLAKKLKDAKAAPPARTEPPPQQQQQRQTQQPQGADVERVVMGNIANYLVGEGIAPERIEAYVVGLLQKNPDLKKSSVSTRFADFQRVHQAAKSRAPKAVTQTRAPVSARGRSGGGTQSSTQPSADPLVLARQGKLRL